jgi:integrase
LSKQPVWSVFLRLVGDGWSSLFASVELLLEHLKRRGGFESSRENYCYNLWATCVWVTPEIKRLNLWNGDGAIDPDNLVSLAKQNPDLVTRLLQTRADKYNWNKSICYANFIIAINRTFFKVNKIKLDLKGFTHHVRSSRKRQEYIPSLNEALRMADVAGSNRDRLIVLVLTYTGLRNSTLRALVYNEAYPDPLLQQYSIKKQLDRNEKFLAIVVDEVMKKHVPRACKNNTPYYTFLPPTVTEALQLHLRNIERKYGKLYDTQPIFNTENRRIPLSDRLRTPICSRELQEIVKNAAKKADIGEWRNVYPHCLRKTYESLLRNQPDTVRLDVKDREFVFGHTMPGSQDTYYDKTKIKEMRTKYCKMIFEPVIIKTEERVVTDVELQTFLQQGWRFVATLQSGKAVVSRKVKLRQPDPNTAVNGIRETELDLQKTEAHSSSKTCEPNSLPNSEQPNSVQSSANDVITRKGQDYSNQLTNHTLKDSETQLPLEPLHMKKNIISDKQTFEAKTVQKTLLDFHF